MKLILTTLTFIGLLWSMSILDEATKKEKTINLALAKTKLQFPNLIVEKKKSDNSIVIGGCGENKNTIFIIPKNISSNLSSDNLFLMLTHEYLHCSKS